MRSLTIVTTIIFLVSLSGCINHIKSEDLKIEQNIVDDNPPNNHNFNTPTPPPELSKSKGSLPSLAVVKNIKSPIGTNAGSISPYGTTWPFINMIKSAQNWGSAGDNGTGNWCWGSGGGTLNLDSNGDVSNLNSGQYAYTRLLWGLSKEQMPTHRGDNVKITVLYSGEGTMTYHYYAEDNDCWNQGSSDKTISHIERSPGKDIIYMNEADMAGRGISIWGLRIRIQSTVSTNHIRDIKVLPPGGVCSNDGTLWCESSIDCTNGASCLSFEGHSDDIVFHPNFIKQNAKYSNIRIMNWINPNSESHGSSWSTRSKVEDARWNLKGVPWEIIFLLANRLNSSPWITLPLNAVPQNSVTSTMPYAEELGKLAHEQLNENLTIHVETGNEVWGDQLETLGASTVNIPQLRDGIPWGADQGDDQVWPNHWNRMIGVVEAAEKSCNGFRIHFNPSKIKCVLATQSGFFGRTIFMLKYLEHKYGINSVKDHFDVLSPSGYFGYQGDNSWLQEGTAARRLDTLITYVTSAVNNSNIAFEKHVNFANIYGLRVDAYEGGQHLVEFDNRDINDTVSVGYIQANADPRMKQIYLTHLNNWKQSGAGLFMHFTTTGRQKNWSGSWGSIDNYNVSCEQAPKCSALQAFINNNQPWF